MMKPTNTNIFEYSDDSLTHTGDLPIFNRLCPNCCQRCACGDTCDRCGYQCNHYFACSRTKICAISTILCISIFVSCMFVFLWFSMPTVGFFVGACAGLIITGVVAYFLYKCHMTCKRRQEMNSIL